MTTKLTSNSIKQETCSRFFWLAEKSERRDWGTHRSWSWWSPKSDKWTDEGISCRSEWPCCAERLLRRSGRSESQLLVNQSVWSTKAQKSTQLTTRFTVSWVAFSATARFNSQKLQFDGLYRLRRLPDVELQATKTNKRLKKTETVTVATSTHVSGESFLNAANRRVNVALDQEVGNPCFLKFKAEWNQRSWA